MIFIYILFDYTDHVNAIFRTGLRGVHVFLMADLVSADT